MKVIHKEKNGLITAVLNWNMGCPLWLQKVSAGISLLPRWKDKGTSTHPVQKPLHV